MKKIFLIIGASLLVAFPIYKKLKIDVEEPATKKVKNIETKNDVSNSKDVFSKYLEEENLPESKYLENDYHIFQTFNNCGPASLSMLLSYFDINVSQRKLGADLRPYQVRNGNNDDKSVSLDELGDKAIEYGLDYYHRPAGDIDLLKKFIANDLPLIVVTRSTKDDDIGHYRVVKGYDDKRGAILQDDSLQGHNLYYSYSDFNELWKTFNYEYIVIFPTDKYSVVQKIIGENLDRSVAWQKAVVLSQEKLKENENDVTARFNLSVALYNTGDYSGSVREFEKVESSLPFRTLWYQIEPIKAYYELERYDRVFEITNNILENGNRAFSELYVIRGNIYKKQGNLELAKNEYEKAIRYKKNYEEAKTLLNNL